MSEPFHHIATLNLFRESYGHEITVSSAAQLAKQETPPDLRPIDHIENLIIEAAERMKARKMADGTFRDASGERG